MKNNGIENVKSKYLSKKNLTNSRQKYTITMTILIFFKIQKIKKNKTKEKHFSYDDTIVLQKFCSGYE